MRRFLASGYALTDLQEIRSYLTKLPQRPGNRIAEELQDGLRTIVQSPFRGQANSELTRAFGEEIRSWPVASYRIYYRPGPLTLEVIGILHTARDHAAILRGRIQ